MKSRPQTQAAISASDLSVVTWRAEKTTFWPNAKMLYNHAMDHHSCSGTAVMTALLSSSFRKLIHLFIAVEWEQTRFTELPHVNTKAPRVSWGFDMSLLIARSSKKTNRLLKFKNKTTFIVMPTKILVSLQVGRLERKGFTSFVACCALAGWTYTLKCGSYHLRGRLAQKCAHSFWHLGRLFPLLLRPSSSSLWVSCSHLLQLFFLQTGLFISKKKHDYPVTVWDSTCSVTRL